MTSKIIDRSGVVIAEVETHPGIGAICVDNRVFTPVHFFHADGSTNWGLMVIGPCDRRSNAL